MDNLRGETPEENLAPSSVSNFLEVQPESRHECSICLNWLQDPVLTTCGHRFCKNCISAWLQQKDYCPIDNVKLKNDVDLFPDNYTRREILQQRTICPYTINGCSVQLTPVDLDSHVAGCEYKNSASRTSLRSKIPCSFRALGCDAILKNEEVLATHIETNMQNHLSLLVGAYSKIAIDQDMDGVNSNQMEQEAMCLWDPQEKQNDSEASPHQTNTSQQMSIKALIRSLYERIVRLEQRNREQDITIGNLSRLVTVMKNNQQRLTDDILLKYCMGVFVWRVDNFSTKLNAMLSDSTKIFYSQGFYTSPNGYRFCARLNLSTVRARCLALHVHLMKTENDDSLDWPFVGRICLTLVNSSIPQLSLKDTMMSKPDLGAFQKPAFDICSKGFGFSDYISIDDIKYKGFLKADTLQIRIKIKQV